MARLSVEHHRANAAMTPDSARKTGRLRGIFKSRSSVNPDVDKEGDSSPSNKLQKPPSIQSGFERVGIFPSERAISGGGSTEFNDDGNKAFAPIQEANESAVDSDGTQADEDTEAVPGKVTIQGDKVRIELHDVVDRGLTEHPESIPASSEGNNNSEDGMEAPSNSETTTPTVIGENINMDVQTPTVGSLSGVQNKSSPAESIESESTSLDTQTADSISGGARGSQYHIVRSRDIVTYFDIDCYPIIDSEDRNGSADETSSTVTTVVDHAFRRFIRECVERNVAQAMAEQEHRLLQRLSRDLRPIRFTFNINMPGPRSVPTVQSSSHRVQRIGVVTIHDHNQARYIQTGIYAAFMAGTVLAHLLGYYHFMTILALTAAVLMGYWLIGSLLDPGMTAQEDLVLEPLVVLCGFFKGAVITLLRLLVVAVAEGLMEVQQAED